MGRRGAGRGLQGVVLPEKRADSAHARAYRHSQSGAVNLGRTGICPSLCRGNQGGLLDPVQSFGFDGGKSGGWVGGHGCGDGYGEPAALQHIRPDIPHA